MFCQKCGYKQPEPAASNCVNCGEVLSLAPPAPESYGDEALSTIIPYRNTAALVGYYLAVFSLIPCAGLLLGPVAVMLGIVGLRRKKQHPEAKGTAHAWTAIILGGVTAIANGVAAAYMAANV